MTSLLERLLGAVRSRPTGSRLPDVGTPDDGAGEESAYTPSERYIAGDGWGNATTLNWAAPPKLGKPAITHPYREAVIWRAALKALAEPFARLPLILWRKDPSEEGATPVGESHPLVRLWRRPNPLLTGCDLWRLHMIGYREAGETYLFLAGLDGKPVRATDRRIEIPAQVIPVFRWSIHESATRRADGLPTGYRYGGQPDSVPDFPPESVIRIIDHDPYNWARGYGDGDALEGVMDLAHQANRYLASFTRSGGDPGAWIKHKGKIGPAERARLQAETDDTFANAGTGSRYRHLDGDLEVIPNNVKPRDMEYGALLKHVQSQILALCGVPAPVIGDLERATYNNIQVVEQLMWRGPNGILSTARKTEDALNEFFLRRVTGADAQWVYRFDTSEVQVLQQDNADALKLAAETAARGVGISVSDALAALGAEAPLPDDAGQDRWLARSLRTAEDRAGETVATVLGTLAQQVAARAIPPEAAVSIAMVSFPGTVDAATASAMFPAPPEPGQQPTAAPIAESDGDESDDATDEEDDESAALARGQDQRLRAADSPLNRYAFRPQKPVEVDRRLSSLIEGWLGDYQAATLALWKRVARDGNRTPIGTLLVTEPGGHRYRDDIPESILNRYILAEAEWAEILASLAGPRVERLFLDALAATQDAIGGPFISVSDPRVLKFFAKQKLDFTRVTATLTEELRDVLFSALTGETAPVEVVIAEKLPELDEGLRRVFGTKEARANAIARTETGRAQNGAQFMQMREAGVTRIGWLHSGNPNGRPDHIALNGVEVELGHKFANGLRYPHDELGEASDVVNCSCAIYAAAFEGDDEA